LKKYSPNAPCPCGSGNKYKKCCQPYHKGARLKDALTLMKSRYSAYAVGQSHYIIATTHPDNPDHREDQSSWAEEIDVFCQQTDFLGLEILEFIDGEREAFVTFRAFLSSGEILERSRFLLTGDRWLYESGDFDRV